MNAPAKIDASTATEVPATLALAVCAVMSELTRLKKADRNKFASYDFTSVDDFKDELRPLFAKNGLYAVPNQADFKLVEMVGDKDKKSTVAQFDFDITLKHVSGEKEDPERMTVILPFTGAQTSGAARSYAIKEWMKGRFLASSGSVGDVQEEADMMDQSRQGMRLSKADARSSYSKLQEELRTREKEGDHNKVAEWWQSRKALLDSLPKDWFLMIKNEYAETYTNLKRKAPAGEQDEASAFDVTAYFEELDAMMAGATDQATIEEVWTTLDPDGQFDGDDTNLDIAHKIKQRHERRLVNSHPAANAS